jgi:hypothetical protein
MTDLYKTIRITQAIFGLHREERMVRSLVRYYVLIFCLLHVPVAGQEAGALNKLGWLSGKWHIEDHGRVIDEQWTTVAGGMMLGVSRTVRDGKTLSFEFLRIVERPDGLVYIAQPEGRPPTEFRLASVDGGEWVFENPEHPFPRRIRYKRVSDDSIVARIEDESGTKHVDFPYLRAR